MPGPIGLQKKSVTRLGVSIPEWMLGSGRRASCMKIRVRLCECDGALVSLPAASIGPGRLAQWKLSIPTSAAGLAH